MLVQKGDALVFKTDDFKYSEALNAMMSDAMLMDPGAFARSMRRTLEMILELKRVKTRKGAAYKYLVKELLGESVVMRAPIAGTTHKVKHLDEITYAKKHVPLR